jgi:Glyoxalase-like domain
VATPPADKHFRYRTSRELTVFLEDAEGRTVKNRVHLDLHAADAEADRLTRLGARILARHQDWITLTDPEGNEFCIQRTAATGTTP